MMIDLCPSCREPLDWPSGDGCAAMNRHKETSGTIIVEEVQEHEDGSATYTMLMDDQSRQLVVSEGVRLIFTCAAYGVDLEDVYDWIASHSRIMCPRHGTHEQKEESNDD